MIEKGINYRKMIGKDYIVFYLRIYIEDCLYHDVGICKKLNECRCCKARSHSYRMTSSFS